MMSSPAFAAALRHERERAERRLQRAVVGGDEAGIRDASARLADLDEIGRRNAPEFDPVPLVAW